MGRQKKIVKLSKRKSTVGVTNDENENEVPSQKSSTKSKQPAKKKLGAREIYKSCEKYHRLKREILAPFITRLLILKRWEDLCEELDDEFTMYDTSLNSGSVNASKRREITLGLITEEDNLGDSSHENDWRNGDGDEEEED